MLLLVIVPKNIYFKGNKEVKDYIFYALKPYHWENRETLLVYKKEELIQLLKKKGFTEQDIINKKLMEDFCHNDLILLLDENGDAINNECNTWDWYIIGGRWDGILNNKLQISEEQYNSEEKHNKLNYNIVTIEYLLKMYNNDNKKFMFHSIIDKNGIFRSNGDFPYQEKIGGWKYIYEKVLNDAFDDYIVSIDLHL